MIWALGACAARNPDFETPEAGADGTPQGGSGGSGGSAKDSLPPPAPPADGPLVQADRPSPSTIDLQTGLVGYWRMDEAASATVARDSSGLNHHGTLEMPASTSWVSGRFGSALRISDDDKNAGVKVLLTNRIDRISRYTLAAWVKRIRLRPLAYQSIISRQLGTGIGEVFDMSVSKDRLQAYAPDRTQQSVTAAAVDSEAPVNRWFHAAATYDGQTIRVYQDGVLEASRPWTNGLPDSDRPLYVGTNKNESGASDAHHPWEGDLDEVLLYDVALPDAAIAALAAGQRPAVP
jgi:hypothetical protein